MGWRGRAPTPPTPARAAPGAGGGGGYPRPATRQYVRKVTGVQSLSDATREPFEAAVAEITEITTRLLEQLPARRQPPATVPPLRRPEVQARIAAKALRQP